jgi:hypothetical protein
MSKTDCPVLLSMEERLALGKATNRLIKGQEHLGIPFKKAHDAAIEAVQAAVKDALWLWRTLDEVK